jgi:YjbE family integral membrane protein
MLLDIEWSEITVLLSVIAIDVTLAVDNALVMGTVAAKLPKTLRKKAIFVGTIAAAIFRILFALVASQLLVVFGLTLAGGMLLLWVAWKLWRDIQADKGQFSSEKLSHETDELQSRALHGSVFQIILADLSMSLDNTLAVAATARNHLWIMVVGLVLSVCLTGFAASLLATILQRFRWASYVGLLIVLYVALNMIWEGAHKVLEAT